MTGRTWCGHWLNVLDAKCWRSHSFIFSMLSSVALNVRKGGGLGGPVLRGQSHTGSSAFAAATHNPHEGRSLDPGAGSAR